MPTAIPVSKESMNYAVVVFVGFIVISAVWYMISGYKNYNGPPSDGFEISTDPPKESLQPNKEAQMMH